MPDRHDADTVRAWVEASCAAQQLPVKVDDETVLARVAGLLGAAPGLPGVPQRAAFLPQPLQITLKRSGSKRL